MAEAENRNQNRKKHTLPEAAKPYQFKPGQSGNPGERPRKKPLTEALERILADPAEADAIANGLVKAAREGNVQAAREIADRVEGKANITGNDQKAPIIIEIASDPPTPLVVVPTKPALSGVQ